MRAQRKVILGCVAALLLAPSCGFGLEEASTGAQTPEETRAQYWEEAKKLPLAPGWNWPPRTPEGVGILDSDPDDGAGNTYGSGYGRGWANDYWFCSWQRRLLEDGLRPAERTEALRMAKKIRETPRYKHFVDEDGRRQYEDMLAEAELGDLSTLRSDFRVSCSQRHR
ncbi:hypothetical protein JGS22_008665 [Streptomyces sp. P38-E01]|uniref:Lipoprotein n=1 Tax=Streptomyces tardus TaxID=2780544 RepID=A0A949JEW4_9ACTN|nr:hypothetical protein [Streptomyces tardus]MBU7597688.1 hypothetical protein [Streptomyces tardus]